MSFAKIAKLHNADKYFNRHYEPLYERILPLYRNLTRPIRLLEIGIDTGASLCIWLEYFGANNISIFGIDISPKAIAAAPSEAITFLGDQADATFLQRVISQSGGQFDIVIDDGGHGIQQQQVSFDVLWPEVVPGGVYIIEDLESSMARWGRREARVKKLALTLDVIFGQIRGQMRQRRRERFVRPLYTFCGEAVAIEKPGTLAGGPAK